jgi:hypothetical protein
LDLRHALRLTSPMQHVPTKTSPDADHGEAFPAELSRQIKARFHHVDHDFMGHERLYFENAGG